MQSRPVRVVADTPARSHGRGARRLPIHRLLMTVAIGIVAMGLVACGANNEPDPTATPDTAATEEAQRSSSAELEVSPIGGSAGTPIEVSGAGWEPGTMVVINIQDDDGESGILAATVADKDGKISTDFKYPSSRRWNSPSVYTVRAADRTEEENNAETQFAVIQSDGDSSSADAGDSSGSADTSAAQSGGKVVAAAPTSTPLNTPTYTPPPTNTPTYTPPPTNTPTYTPPPTNTPTYTPPPTNTPTYTPPPTNTPTLVPPPTYTSQPTYTPQPTYTVQAAGSQSPAGPQAPAAGAQAPAAGQQAPGGSQSSGAQAAGSQAPAAGAQAPAAGAQAPTYTPLPTYTSLPTYTPLPTYTALPTYTPEPPPKAQSPAGPQAPAAGQQAPGGSQSSGAQAAGAQAPAAGAQAPVEAPTNTPTNTPTSTPTNTPTYTPPPTHTPTHTPTNTPTYTPPPTNTPTYTPPPTNTPTNTPEPPPKAQAAGAQAPAAGAQAPAAGQQSPGGAQAAGAQAPTYTPVPPLKAQSATDTPAPPLKAQSATASATALPTDTPEPPLKAQSATNTPAPAVDAVQAPTETAVPPQKVATVVATASSLSRNGVRVWRGNYWANTTFDGPAALIRRDEVIDFDWGDGGPDPAFAPDGFSVRWTNTINIETAGTYRFVIEVDDGARFFVDDELLLDNWRTGSQRAINVDTELTAGEHDITFEYFEDVGKAVAKLGWMRLVNPAEASAPPTGAWLGEYFDNDELAGVPIIVRNESAVNFNWNTDSPGPGIPSDNFSARWQRNVDFDAGVYRFEVEIDDGMRVWVGDRLVIDQWQDNRAATYTAEVSLPAGEQVVRVEYFENTLGARAIVSWSQIDKQLIAPTPTWTPESAAGATTNSLTRRVAAGSDDAEQRENGDVSLGSDELEMTQSETEHGQQLIGLRFVDITIPQGATVTNAYIEFTTEFATQESTSLNFYGEAAADAETFAEAGNNISSRDLTDANVSWLEIPAWTAIGSVHQTPDLSAIINEVVGQDEWVGGGAIGFIIAGNGQRIAESYDGDAAAAANLVVEYSAP